ncbi:carboxypeptidase-like regulatory domain-containing protein [Flavobacteriaceae bacterium D16]|nr:carboxypeptidase-like regulatory domain-containing protein [Flavobacteriaceae bacterium D16]
MPRISLPTILFFFFCSLSLWSQDFFSGPINGKVVQGTRGIPDVHVMNISASTATITNALGSFSITASIGDSLVFSAIQLESKTIVVSTEIMESQSLVVYMEDRVNLLDEVILRPYNLSGELARDMQNAPKEKVYVASTLGLPNAYVKPKTLAERRLFEAVTGGGLVPLNPVINAITGRTKYLKKVLETENKYARTERVMAFYPDSLYVSELHIPSNRISDFMYFCEVDAEFNSIVDSRDKLKIWEFLKVKSAAYRANNDLD